MHPKLKAHLALSHHLNSAKAELRAALACVPTKRDAAKLLRALEKINRQLSDLEDRGFREQVPGYSIGVCYPCSRTDAERAAWGEGHPENAPAGR